MMFSYKEVFGIWKSKINPAKWPLLALYKTDGTGEGNTCSANLGE